MGRYFIEVSYNGTNYSGFQTQQNANSIQAEVTKALKIFFKQDFELTGSSRTDAGVHALQNFFHFDVEDLSVKIEAGTLKKTFEIQLFQDETDEILRGAVYNLNALLPWDIVIKNILRVKDNAHARFDALSREYKYFIYQKKNPFLHNTAYFYPYKLDINKLNEAANKILINKNFISFSKKNTQVNNFFCDIKRSQWTIEDDKMVYTVVANRFLRGMVKSLVGTMLRVGTNKISIDQFTEVIKKNDCSNADFSPPSSGLFLISVTYPFEVFIYN